MAIAEKITGVMTGVSPFGKYYPHPLLSAGSLLLFDPTHSMGAFSGVPVNWQALPNVADGIAAGVVGGTVATRAVRCTRSTGVVGASLVERSGKGGIHGLFSEVTTGAAQYVGIAPESAIRDYMWANRATHQFFVGGWYRQTRAIQPSAAPQAPMYCATSTSAYWYQSQNGTVVPSVQGGRRSAPAALTAIASGTPVIMDVAVNAWTGTVPGSPHYHVFAMGAHGPWESYNNAHPLGGIIENYYIEDLAISGRTYAEVDALYLALHTAAHASGGVWYGDTYTSPASFP